MKHYTHAAVVVLVGLAAGFVSGCAQMTVRVSVFNREKADDSTPFIIADARQQRDKILAERGTGKQEAAKERIKSDVRRAYKKIGENIAAARRIPTDVGDELLKAIEREVDDTFAEANQTYDAGLANLDRLQTLTLAHAGQRRSLAVSARQYFADGRQVLSGLTAKLEGFFEKLLPDELKMTMTTSEQDETTLISTKAVNNASNRIEGLIGDATLLDDPMTPLIVTAPSKYWRGTFNKTFGSGLFGNTDIAVKMQSLGDFSLKGVRNDATKTTPAAFQGAVLMTKLAAASFGVPVGAFGAAMMPAPSDTSETDATEDSTAADDTDSATVEITSGGFGDDLLEADRVRREARRQIRLSKHAALQILGTIVSQRAGFTAKGDEAANPGIPVARKKAIAQVKKSFEDNRSVLEIQSQAQP